MHLATYVNIKILNRLRVKQNWISEISILKRSFPKQWLKTTTQENSFKSKVLIDNVVKVKNKPLLTFTNKELYSL